MILRYVAGPAVGAVIGYCTNYLAVKMLFLPRKEIHLFGHRLPFTPGAIPKGKPRLAKAMGNIVSTMLLTEEDVKGQLCSDKVQNMIVEKIMEKLSHTVHDTMIEICQSEAVYENLQKKVCTNITNQIVDAVKKIDLITIIEEEGSKAIKEKVTGTMLQMFVTDDLIRSFIRPMGGKMIEFVSTNGASYIEPEVNKKLKDFSDMKISDVANVLGMDEGAMRIALEQVCKNLVQSSVSGFMQTLDIAAMVEAKINAMDVMELENLVLTVMKKELNTIVNLGALIGAVLGMINVFF